MTHRRGPYFRLNVTRCGRATTNSSSEDVQEDAISKAVGQYVLRNIRQADIKERVRETAEFPDPEDVDLTAIESATADEIYAEIIDELDGNPPTSWTKINTDLVDERRIDADEALESYENDVLSRTRKCLRDMDIEISVTFGDGDSDATSAAAGDD